MSFLKSLLPGTVVTYLVAGAIGHGHSTGGVLNVYRESIHGMDFYWSWPLMGATTLLFWALATMMND